MTGRPWIACAASTKRRVVQERLDAVDALVVAVRVLLAEVARAHRERRDGLVGAGETAGAQEVRQRVLALRETAPDVGLDAVSCSRYMR